MTREVYFKKADSEKLVFNLLMQNTPVSFTAGGPSMTPTIRDGELVQVRPLRPGDLRPGAIVLGRHKGRPILHRLIRIDSRTKELLLAGDASLRGTDRAAADTVAGIATAVRRNKCLMPLDTRAQRAAGMLRHRLRPLRRLLRGRCHPPHAGTS
jgi:hypothetical protein